MSGAICPPDPYKVINYKSIFADQQILKIEEHHGQVPAGELPRTLIVNTERLFFGSCVFLLFEHRYLTGKVKPGMRIVITGIHSTHFQNISKGCKRQVLGLFFTLPEQFFKF